MQRANPVPYACHITDRLQIDESIPLIAEIGSVGTREIYESEIKRNDPLP